MDDRLQQRIDRAKELLFSEKMKQEVRIPVINGLNSIQRSHIRSICFRIAFLYVKITGCPTLKHRAARKELDALEWALQTIRDYYDHINQCESDEQNV